MTGDVSSSSPSKEIQSQGSPRRPLPVVPRSASPATPLPSSSSSSPTTRVRSPSNDLDKKVNAVEAKVTANSAKKISGTLDRPFKSERALPLVPVEKNRLLPEQPWTKDEVKKLTDSYTVMSRKMKVEIPDYLLIGTLNTLCRENPEDMRKLREDLKNGKIGLIMAPVGNKTEMEADAFLLFQPKSNKPQRPPSTLDQT